MRGLYESFFMGIERSPPEVLRRDINRQILEMQQVTISNSSLRFRYQALTQRWVLLITYWNRTMREIEAGTFSRDLAKAKRHMASKGTSAVTLEEALAMGIPASRAKAFVAHQQATQERRAAAAQLKAGAKGAARLKTPDPRPRQKDPPGRRRPSHRPCLCPGFQRLTCRTPTAAIPMHTSRWERRNRRPA